MEKMKVVELLEPGRMPVWKEDFPRPGRGEALVMASRATVEAAAGAAMGGNVRQRDDAAEFMSRLRAAMGK